MYQHVVGYSERLGELTRHESRLTSEIGAVVERVPLWSATDIEAQALAVDALIVGAVEPLHGAALSALSRCRVISRRGVGLDNIDVAAATELGILVAYVPAASVHEVSDHALALILACERKVVALDRTVQDGQWTKDSNEVAGVRADLRRLADLTLGVVGYGRIGRELARKASPIFRSLLVHDPVVEEGTVAGDATVVSLDQLLRECDVISLHAPLTSGTAHLLDAEAFAKAKPGLTLVNTSRGGLIDSAALLAALDDGTVARAGLDVTEQEPIPADSPLLGRANVVLTGHSAASSTGSAAELRSTTVQAVLDVLRGVEPEFLANPEVLDHPRCRL